MPWENAISNPVMIEQDGSAPSADTERIASRQGSTGLTAAREQRLQTMSERPGAPRPSGRQPGWPDPPPSAGPLGWAGCLHALASAVGPTCPHPCTGICSPVELCSAK